MNVGTGVGLVGTRLGDCVGSGVVGAGVGTVVGRLGDGVGGVDGAAVGLFVGQVLPSMLLPLSSCQYCESSSSSLMRRVRFATIEDNRATSGGINPQKSLLLSMKKLDKDVRLPSCDGRLPVKLL